MGWGLGQWLFHGSIGPSKSLIVIAKPWALRDGIAQCKDPNIQAVVIELDASLVVNLITSDNSPIGDLSIFD